MKTLDNLDNIERRETVDNFKANDIIGGGSGDNKERAMSDFSSIMPGGETETNYRPNDSMASLADMMNNHKFGKEKDSKPEAASKVPGLDIQKLNKESDESPVKPAAATQRVPESTTQDRKKLFMDGDDNILSKSSI